MANAGTMAQFWNSLFTHSVKSAVISAAFLVPIFLVGWLLIRLRVRHDREASAPFADLPLRPPGESLRLAITELESKFHGWITIMFMVASVAAVAVLEHPGIWKQAAIGMAAVDAIALLRLLMIVRQLWPRRLGMTGERAVAEELNQLLRHGFYIYHDLPFDGYNIDHVVVGSPGVFAIETKTQRKPWDEDGTKEYQVVVDGEILYFPQYKDKKAAPHALRSANSLGNWLGQAAGENVAVSAILALPGWWVERRNPGAVAVYNPKEIRNYLTKLPPDVLSPSQILRINFQIGEKCKMASPAG